MTAAAEDIDRLIAAWLDGVADPAQVARLDSLLRDDPGVARSLAAAGRIDLQCWRLLHSSRIQEEAGSISGPLRQVLSHAELRRRSPHGRAPQRWRSLASVRRSLPAATLLAVLVLVVAWWATSSAPPERPIIPHGVGSNGEGSSVQAPGSDLVAPSPRDPAGDGASGGETLVFERAASFGIGSHIRVLAAAGTQLRLPSRLDAAPTLHLLDGRVDLEVDREPLVVLTPALQVEVLSTRFTLSHLEGRSRIEVSEGTVKVRSDRHQEPVLLAAGDTADSAAADLLLPSDTSVPLFVFDGSRQDAASLVLHGSLQANGLHSEVEADREPWPVSRLRLTRHDPPLFVYPAGGIRLVADITPAPDMDSLQVVAITKERDADVHQSNVHFKQPIDARRGRQRVILDPEEIVRTTGQSPNGGRCIVVVLECFGIQSPFVLHALVVEAAPARP